MMQQFPFVREKKYSISLLPTAVLLASFEVGMVIANLHFAWKENIMLHAMGTQEVLWWHYGLHTVYTGSNSYFLGQ